MAKVRENRSGRARGGPLLSPLQLSVYWRLSLIFFFTSFLFFLDIFTAAVAAETCHNNTSPRASWLGKLLRDAEDNQSALSEVSGADADWRTESGSGDVSEDDS